MHGKQPPRNSAAAIEQLLRKHDIVLDNLSPGSYYVICPECAHGRKKQHQGQRKLSVKIDNRGVCWCCQHCGWSGPAKSDRRSTTASVLHDYYDGDDQYLYTKKRFPRGHEPRCIWQRRHGKGGWLRGKGDLPRVIYRLPQILDAIEAGQSIAVVEGESDADALWDIGIPATCSQHGAAEPGKKPKWIASDSACLRGAADVVVFSDHDAPGYAHQNITAESAAKLARRVRVLKLADHWPECPDGGDVRDWLAAGHTKEELLRLMETAPDFRASVGPGTLEDGGHQERVHHTLDIGSDVEIAKRAQRDLNQQYGDVVHAEGAFWHFRKTYWDVIPEHELRLTIHAYDGAIYYLPSGEPATIKLSKGRIDSIINETGVLCADPTFFHERQTGINCASGFIRFGTDGSTTLEPHAPAHRCRNTLPGHWHVGANATPPETSLLHTLLEGMFRGDDDAEEKVNLLSEILGVAALGYATKLMQPRAAVFWGKTAENGKSQINDMARGLLSATAVCCVPPGKMGDERHIVGLVGKLLNATDELSSAHAVASDKFKAVVTGEPIDGRDVYTKRVEFRSMAQCIHATNTLPSFQGGMDRGVQRRLLLLVFNRTIPEEERIENIGQRIAAEEADLLLAWAVAGASRAVKNRNFKIPKSCKAALNEWIYSADPVIAWVHQCVKAQPTDEPDIKRERTRDAYAQFKIWAVQEGFKEERLPELNSFTTRVTANAAGVEYKRTADGRWFERMIINTSSDGAPSEQGQRACIRAVLLEAKEPMCVAEIAEKAGMKQDSLRYLLKAMQYEMEIQTVAAGVYQITPDTEKM